MYNINCQTCLQAKTVHSSDSKQKVITAQQSRLEFNLQWKQRKQIRGSLEQPVVHLNCFVVDLAQS